MNIQITDKASVEVFFTWLLEQGCIIDPDDTYHDFVNRETGEPTFDYDTAEAIDNTMQDCIDWGEANGVDIYKIAIILQTKESLRLGIFTKEVAEEILANTY